MHTGPIGVLISAGLSDWQILQQGDDGFAETTVAGSWSWPEPGHVEIRLVREDSGAAVTAKLDWHRAEDAGGREWRATLHRIPAGGLYRLESRLLPDAQPHPEWAIRGDQRHYLGVGDLWLIAGQSNAAGYGRGPYMESPALGVHVFRPSRKWALASHPLNESTDAAAWISRDAANNAHSPFLRVGQMLQRELGYPIGLIAVAVGGSALAEWSSQDAKPAPLREAMMEAVRCVGGRVRGMFWYQGEAEACGGRRTAETYRARFAEAVVDWRKGLGVPKLPVITAQLNRWFTQPNADIDAGWSIVREAQRQAARILEGVWVVPTLDLPLCDFIHNSPAGNGVLAWRFGQTALGAVYGRGVAFRAPEIAEARRAEEGRVLELRFAHVMSRLDPLDPCARPFTVRDEEGEVGVLNIETAGADSLRLVLARVVGPVAWLGAGGGVNPPVMPIDVERQMPILAFSNFAF